ncbi:MAG: FtsX-like permease family protein [Alphaproteobacteria bacterium]|nr:FtsX-like permease family protein [Alphaproteobacteria bacterium]
MKALDAKLFRDLWRIRLQALAIALVIGCGVAVVIMSFGAMRSLSETRDAYYDRYRFADVFAKLKRAPLTLVDDISALPGVARAEPRIVHYVTLDIPGLDRPAVGELVSLAEEGKAALNAILLKEGRYPRPGHGEVIVSENLAEAHGWHPGAAFQGILNGRKRTLVVSGIAQSPEFVYILDPGQLVPDNKTFGILWMPREELEATFDLDGAFNQISVTLMRGASEPDVIERMDNLLAPYGGTGAYGRDEQLSHAFLDQELQQLRTIATLIPPIFLGVASFLINIILSRLVETEREQIGLLKAFGYGAGEVGWHYLKFALVIVIGGLAIGAAVGLWMGVQMTTLYQQYFRFPFLYYRIDPFVLLASFAVSLAAGMLGTIGAVRAATRLSPAVAMAPAPPATYRRSLFEFIGVAQWIPAQTQMIIRHIERWPLRALTTSLGVALSGGLLVMTFYFFDAIDELIDSYYFRSNRQDATVDFLEPLDPRAVGEVGRMPGVRLAEPLREVPVRLHFEHREKLVRIYGILPNTTLKRFIDVDGKSFDVPPEGIVLGDHLSRTLGAQVGNTIRTDILEGRRGVGEVRVAAIVRENVGLSAYMEADALNRLIGEGPAVTGAQIMIDPTQTSAFYGTLKETPATGMVMLREPAIASFRDTLAKNMLVVISFYVVFGVTITFGVVYNAARIMLSERARELASLRVLGFTRGDVAYILLGELALLVAVALLPACALGYLLSWVMSHAMDTDLFRIPLVVRPSTYATGVVILILSAAASALAVAWRVNRLDLIAVLKTRD